ncbi:MAG: TIGR01212 family radical SAM protein [Desulfosarcina sp.]|nr:TIGR01212 family radical SAM protein [Desulfobacterales bacterium]
MGAYYYDLNTYFREKFGERVHKLTVDAGFDCPNRDGSIARGGCIYCNPQGSGSGLFAQGFSIKDQLERSRAPVARRFKVRQFIAYFQSFTNTYAPLAALKSAYDEALAVPDIVGLSIGTRPDCIDDQILALLEQYARRYLVWVEYGLQSAHDRTLATIRRGHDVRCFIDAVERTRNRGIAICAHVILGLPGESRRDMLETTRLIADLNLDGIKLHLLYVVRGTLLAAEYRKGNYRCLEQEEYADLVCDVIERLPPGMVIQRITGDPHPRELVAPAWALQKKQTIEMIHARFKARQTRQGSRYQTSDQYLRRPQR